METQTNIPWPTGLAGYTPIEEISVGRISRLVAATDAETGRRVAVKILHDHLAAESTVRQRLRREFAAIRRLNHPAIIRAEQLVETDETVALVMECVDGESVRTHVQDHGPMDFDEARPVLDDVLAALSEAHQKGILHRDLNAEHVLIDDNGRGRIVGFGLARVDELAAITMHTRVLGAMEATAPERLVGTDYDGRADLYSVGAVAHELLVGHPPSTGTLRESLHRADEPGPALEEDQLDELPPEARYLIERSLVSDPTARFATADQMLQAIDGDYDRRFWNRWTSRQTRPCPSCETPIIDGLLECIHCGHEFRRLVQNPGGGDHAVMIISPKEAFDPDIGFEKNYEPEFLKTETVESLMELLDDYEDTAGIADWSPDYRWPPYILVDQLDEADADRLSAKLEERDIPCRILEPRSLRRERPLVPLLGLEVPDGLSDFGWVTAGMVCCIIAVLVAYWNEMETDVLLGSYLSVAPMLLPPLLIVIPLFLIVMVNQWGVRETIAFFAIFAGLGLIGYIGWTLSVSTMFIAAAMGGFVATHGAIRLGTKTLLNRRETGDDTEQVRDLPLMISTDDLEALDLPDETIELPRRTARVLQRCSSDAVRAELHDLLVLAVAAARRSSTTDTEAFDRLVNEILTTGQHLDELTGRPDNDSAARLVDELEDVEATLEADEPDTDRHQVQQRRDELLEQLEARDRTVRRATRARTTLQRARGQLMEMLAGEPSPNVTLDFDDDPNRVLARLADQIDAEAEVHELTTAAGADP